MNVEAPVPVVSAAILQFLQLVHEEEHQAKRRFWVHPLCTKRNLKSFIKELRSDPAKFFNFCRMTPKTFDMLLELTRERISKKNTNFRKCIPPEERLIITLR